MNLQNRIGILKLAVLTVGAPLLVYVYAIRPAFALRHTVECQASELAAARAASADKPHQATAVPPTGNRLKTGKILYDVAPLAEARQVTADRFLPILTAHSDQMELYTGELTLGGSFYSLTHLLSEIEGGVGNERIVAVEYRVTEYPADRRRSLQLTLFLQQITSTD
ncbi:MAG: hypothetical protein LBU80_02235 [Rikenellaceae bacterium]|jgi:hypothetical protein|nr:hypothetical protein [Rikenellaceae bacterium]